MQRSNLQDCCHVGGSAAAPAPSRVSQPHPASQHSPPAVLAACSQSPACSAADPPPSACHASLCPRLQTAYPPAQPQSWRTSQLSASPQQSCLAPSPASHGACLQLLSPSQQQLATPKLGK